MEQSEVPKNKESALNGQNTILFELVGNYTEEEIVRDLKRIQDEVDDHLRIANLKQDVLEILMQELESRGITL